MRAAIVPIGDVVVGSVFDTWELGRDAVYAQEERLGHKWRIAQGKKFADGDRKKVTLRCNHYYHHAAAHSPQIDPSDFRNGRSIKTECQARVNLNRIEHSHLWRVALLEWQHNHEREIHEGGFVPRPPTKQQREVVTKLSGKTNFTRDHISHLLKEQFPNHPMESRQISNMLNKARRDAVMDI